MSTKQTEALKLALEGLEKWHFDKDPRGADQYITAIREALAEQPAQGCEFCSHPLYAGTKCKNCGKPAQQDMPKLGCVNHDCDQCKAQQQEPFVTKNKNGITLHVGWDDLPVGTKLYKSPPASKPWVGLTDEERDAILNREFKQWWSRHDAVCRAIEAKLKDKNGY